MNAKGGGAMSWLVGLKWILRFAQNDNLSFGAERRGAEQVFVAVR
jgi:hypothetical protein